MKVCNTCRNQVDDSYTICPNCGNPNLMIQPVQQPMYQQQIQEQPMNGQPIFNQPVQEQKGNIGWGILGFFIPIVGWILYFCWKNTKPGNAKMAGIGGIIGFCLNLIIQFAL